MNESCILLHVDLTLTVCDFTCIWDLGKLPIPLCLGMFFKEFVEKFAKNTLHTAK